MTAVEIPRVTKLGRGQAFGMNADDRKIGPAIRRHGLRVKTPPVVQGDVDRDGFLDDVLARQDCALLVQDHTGADAGLRIFRPGSDALRTICSPIRADRHDTRRHPVCQ